MTGRLRLGYLSLVMSALLFGGATPLAVYALRGLTAFDLLAVEIGSATVVLWLALAIAGQRTTRRWLVASAAGMAAPRCSSATRKAGASKRGSRGTGG